MKRVSTGVLAVLMVAGLGLNAVAALANPASHGNIGPNAIAQATPAASPSPAATAMASPAPAGTMMPSSAPAAAPPPMNFGSPPSGQIPILFNDHHVYARPDKLKQGRVLAALIRGGTILIPLRSMFEQMGATVSYDPGSRTVDVSKPGSDVKVTVGKPQVIINGETRPLDVPPEIYQGHVVVPVRVISEGMGAYVQWVPDRHIVVVRYLPATPPPPPPPPPATPAPTPTPTPVPAAYEDHFIAGDYIISPKVYNEFSPGNTGSNSNGGFSYRVHGAFEFDVFNLPWMLEGDWRQYNYPHNQGVATTPANTPFSNPGQGEICDGLNGHAASGDPGCVTAIGGQFQTFVPAFTARDQSVDVRLGLRVLQPRIYIGVGYLWRTGNYGYPRIQNVGFGIEKLPDLDSGFTVYGSGWYYPNVNGNGTGCVTLPTNATTANNGCGNSQPFNLSYNIWRYDAGVAFTFGPSVPIFVELGYLGENGQARNNAPIGFTQNGPYAGIGLKF